MTPSLSDPKSSGPTNGPASSQTDGETFWYGADALQFATLFRARTPDVLGVVVILHGGYWRSEWGSVKDTAPIALDLAGRGYHAWNVEYRGVDAGGGWPSTFADVAAGIDLLATVPDLHLPPVLYLGHSAGGLLSLWAASRTTLPSGSIGSGPKVQPTCVIALAGVLDLRAASKSSSGSQPTLDLMGGTPGGAPERYRLADPILRLPLGIPSIAVHSRSDEEIPFAYSDSFVTAAKSSGDHSELIEVNGDHFGMIDPSSAVWDRTLQVLAHHTDGAVHSRVSE
jgi:acetyl esterase/lipase